MLGGLLGGDSPNLQVVELDPGTKKLIQDKTKLGQQTVDQIAAQDNAGVREAGAQGMQTDAQIGEHAAATGQDPGMLTAIRNQYNQVAGKSIQDLTAKNRTQAALKKAQRLNDATSAMLAQNKVETQNYSQLADAMNQAEVARSQVLASVLGVGGMVAGKYLGSTGNKSTGNTNNFNIGSSPGSNYGGPNTFGGEDFASRLDSGFGR